MARKSKSLAGAFNQFQESVDEHVNENENPVITNENEDEKLKPESKSSNVTYLKNNQDVKENETVNHHIDAVTEDVIQESNTDADSDSATENQQQEPSTKTIRDVKNSIMNMYDKKRNQKTVEETHTRSTFLFRNDLQKRLDKLADGKRGFKTMFLNKAIEALLDEMDDEQK